MFKRTLFRLSLGAMAALGSGTLVSPAEAQTTNWTGPYIGASGSYLAGNVRWKSPSGPVYTVSDPAKTIDTSGALFSGKIGYNQQFGQFVLGGEVDWGGGSMSGSSSCTARQFVNSYSFSGTDYPSTNVYLPAKCSSEIESVLTLAARAGWAFDNFLVYGLVGYTQAQYRHKLEVIGSGPIVSLPSITFPGSSASVSRSHDGFVVGGGFDYKLVSWLSVGIEYKHIFFDGAQVRFNNGYYANTIPDPDVIGVNLKISLGDVAQAPAQAPSPPAAQPVAQAQAPAPPPQQAAAAPAAPQAAPRPRPTPAAARAPAAPRPAAPAAPAAARQPVEGAPREAAEPPRTMPRDPSQK